MAATFSGISFAEVLLFSFIRREDGEFQLSCVEELDGLPIPIPHRACHCGHRRSAASPADVPVLHGASSFSCLIAKQAYDVHAIHGLRVPSVYSGDIQQCGIPVQTIHRYITHRT